MRINGYWKGKSGYPSSTTTDSYDADTILYRLSKVNFHFTKDGANPDTSATPTTVVNFQQWNLWRVWNSSKTRYYDIEHEEEYLNNYASDQGYGETQNGMPYGLEGIQLSNKYQSIIASQEGESLGTLFNSIFSSITDMANAALKGVAKYDFYMPRDFEDITLNEEQNNSLTIRQYSGREFNNEIATTLKTISSENAKIEGIILTESPKSAFAYCYHKNKRNANGVVEVQKWYLPAIDEIEDIALGAYDEFDKVFQNQKYWSCQPAYNKESLSAKIETRTDIGEAYLKADYYIDNVNRARATSVYTNDGETYSPISSSAPGYSGKNEGTANATYDNWYDIVASGFTFQLEHSDIAIAESEYSTKTPGNLPRTASCRIRAVYRSGEVTATATE